MYFIPRRIVSMNVEPGSRKGEMVPVCWGYASRPFALDRPSRRMRVLAIPRFDCPATGLGDEALPRAREFLRTTTFEPMSAQPLRAFATAFEQFEGTLTDEDDEARRDWKREGSEIDPSDLILEEVVLPVDVEASVHGPWSSSEGAIVAPGTLPAATHVVAVLGPPNEKLDKLEVEHSTTTYVITATVLLALGAGLSWLGNIFPTLQ
jgi:hypothetical protein